MKTGIDKPILIDFFCKAGGCTKGYQDAGFYVIGVDIVPQKHYCGDAFILGCAMTTLRDLLSGSSVRDTEGGLWRLEDIDVFAASPPCQGYSKTARINTASYPLLIEQVRSLIQSAGKPYVIENVEGAPLINPIRLLGTMFGLLTVRPRLFECNFPVEEPPILVHNPRQAKMGRPPKEGEYIHVVGNFSGIAYAKLAMDIDWMNRNELREAIPPAYTRYIGNVLLNQIGYNNG